MIFSSWFEIDVVLPSFGFLLLCFDGFFTLPNHISLTVEGIFVLAKPHFDFVKLGADLIGFVCELLLLLDRFSGRVDLRRFDNVIRFLLCRIRLPLEVELQGLGLSPGDYLIDDSHQATSQEKAYQE